MVISKGLETATLSEADVRELLESAFAEADLAGKRVLVIIPDGTRTAPIPLVFRLLYELLGSSVARLDYLIALGTHQPMSEAAIEGLVGVSKEERATRYPKTAVYNHDWGLPETLVPVGTISSGEMAELTGGLVSRETAVTINRMIFAYDHLVIAGPVFPHEVAGFSGGAKYLFPGISGREIIDSSHWTGALATSYDTIGVKDTAVRRVLHRAAEFVTSQKPLTCLKMVMKGKDLHGLYIGDYLEAWEAAADLSAKLNIVYKPKPFKQVLSMASTKYDDLWTAAKATYKTEPVVEDGGEVIIYAPHIRKISVTHGRLIEQIGYHVRDYFVKQWEKYGAFPWTILAHSTHVKGAGSFENGIEIARIRVTLATSIDEETCRAVNLGYRDHREIDPQAWRDREDEGLLLVENAGEHLYRVATESSS
ncbi:MAG: lactate racemase domain-containing protein [Deinococcota bacterium]|jgi:nickel-dependent lactate racemase|nr:lactate racemase domain-containing protein [Deinococcota bacterium]